MTEKALDEIKPGLIVLFGSGETSASGRKIFDFVLNQLPPQPRVALLETPAGFELNSDRVIGRIAEFFLHRLQNYNPVVKVIRARRKGTEFSPDNPEIVAPLLEADLIFMGPGSPTYAVRQLKDSLAWNYLLARHRLGAALTLASSAVVAIGEWALPVYEIYKVGEDLHWKEGLDFFGQYGLSMVFIPHWNNQDGGEELDTSRCFMGKPRFARLMDLLEVEKTVVGIDENTALIIDLQAEECRVMGAGSVTLIHTGHQHAESLPALEGTGLDEIAESRFGHVHIYQNGQVFPFHDCFPIDIRAAVSDRPLVEWKKALEVHEKRKAERVQPEIDKPVPVEEAGVSDEISILVENREIARKEKDWKTADSYREQIHELGWTIIDTPEGPHLVKNS